MESSSGSDVAKPELIHKLEGSTDEIHGAVVIPGKKIEGPNFVTGKVVCGDRIRTILGDLRIWIKLRQFFGENSFDCKKFWS
jgi:hypothetical protein